VARSPRGEVEFRYTPREGEDVVTALARARAQDVVQGEPVRSFGSHAGMGHYPGWWWSATAQDHVGYESLLERDRLMLADFDPAVTAIASQPFGISGRDGDCVRRHVPDYLLVGPGNVTVVDVKPFEQLRRPEVAAVLSWTGRLMAARGWRYEVWSGRRGDAVDECSVHLARPAPGLAPWTCHGCAGGAGPSGANDW